MAPQYEVVLCRGLSEQNDSQEAYVNSFKTAGYTCHIIPTLCFKFVNMSELRTCLNLPDSYYGTSFSRFHNRREMLYLLFLTGIV